MGYKKESMKMKLFMKEFDSFEKGIKELTELSFSVSQSLAIEELGIPDEAEAVTRLALNVAFDRPTANGVDWSRASVDITAFGVDYVTTGGLMFGWQTVLGANAFDTFEDEYVFYIAHPEANDESAAPENSTLRESAEKLDRKSTRLNSSHVKI